MKENVFNDPKYFKEFALQILFLTLKVTRYIFCDIFQLMFFFEKTQSSDFHYDFLVSLLERDTEKK